MLCGKRVVAVIQARQGSSRLPGKTLAKIAGKTLLERVVERTRAARGLDGIVVATSNLPADDPVAHEAMRLGTRVFRGDEKDVLKRVFEAALAANADVVVRVCADNPFLDSQSITEEAEAIACQGFDYATNSYSGGAPPGTVSEALNFAALREAHSYAREAFHREHVTPFVRANKENFKHKLIPIPAWMAKEARLCIDTREDLELVRKIFSKLGKSTGGRPGLRKAIELAEKLRPATCVFLTEASTRRGMGHLMRCLTVAGELRETRKYERIGFIVNREKNRFPARLCGRAGFPCVEVKFDSLSKPNASEARAAIVSSGAVTVVTDIFRLDSGLARKVIPPHCHVVAIDDVGGRKVHASVIVNPTIVSSWHEYAANPDFPGQQVLAGAAYVPVRQEALRLHGKFKLHKRVEKIVTSMGGGDEFELTPKACGAIRKALDSTGSNSKVFPIIGPAFTRQNKNKILAAMRGDSRFRPVAGGAGMLKLIASSDVSVTSGGITMYESALLGVPVAVIPRTREWEGKAARQLQKMGAAIACDNAAQLEKAVKKIISSFELRRKMSKAGRKLLDGKGAERVALAIAGVR